MAGTILGTLALVVSVVSVLIALRSDRSARRSANEAVEAGRRERQPRLAIVLSHPEPAPNDLVIYRVRNDGPQDLDSVVMHRPLTPDGIQYVIALTGALGRGFVDFELELGPLALTQEARVTLIT